MIVAASWWEQNNATVLFTLLAGGLAILGGVVGSMLSNRSGHQSWLRDRRLDSYSDFLTAVDQAWKVISHRYEHQPLVAPSTEQTAFEIEINDSLTELATAQKRVVLVGPTEVGAAARDLFLAYSEAMDLVVDPVRHASTKSANADSRPPEFTSVAEETNRFGFLATKAVQER